MLLFGHIGITLGVGIAGLAAWKRVSFKLPASSFKSTPQAQQDTFSSPQFSNPSVSPFAKGRGIWLLFWCAVGSLLPDIIDKPIGNFIFVNTFHGNGRIFAHTLLFALIVLAAGLILYFTKHSKLGLVVAYGVFMHLILDFMWQTPQTLFWPLQGWAFPISETTTAWTSWIAGMWHGLISNPVVWIPEGVGLGITLWIGIKGIHKAINPNI